MPDIVFPLPVPPLNAYWEHNQTSFAWRRDGGRRQHGGIDLEAHLNTPVLAIADGIVLRIAYFYDDTYAIEVQHPGVGIVRYGEVSSNALVLRGQKVSQGQIIGFVGKRKKAERFMLHLELFSDWTRIPNSHTDRLSNTENTPFQRRDDLLNPTDRMRTAVISATSNLTLHPACLALEPYRSLLSSSDFLEQQL